jgi:thiol-disulfide isomerase/thioredoxin
MIPMLFSCNNIPKQSYTNEIKTVSFDELAPLLNKKDDKIYVVNFWATWCAPCVKELPYFEKLTKNNPKEKLEVILVSLDFPNQLESRLEPFARKNQLQSTLLFLDEPNENEWIPKIDSNWSGSIPATIIYNKNERQFFEKAFTEQELNQIVNYFKQS